MPELPEVETVCRSLADHLLGRQFMSLEVRRPKSFPNGELITYCLHSPVTALKRRAKMIEIDLANGYCLLTHLKMTGQLLWRGETLAGGGHPTSDVLQQLPGKHTRLIYVLDDGSQLFFNDLRVFGWMKVMPQMQLVQEYQSFGPDANQEITFSYWQAELARRRVTIKQVLMDNHVVSGIGNIYAAEILFAAGIDPRRAANSLTAAEINQLAAQTTQIMRAAIAARGTTFDGRYLDSNGQAGNYVTSLQVYGRAGKTCPRCQQQLQSVKISGRSTVFCPQCQK